MVKSSTAFSLVSRSCNSTRQSL